MTRALFITVFLLLLPLKCFSDTMPSAASSPDAASQQLFFQILQDEFVIDSTTVENAFIVEENGVYRGLKIRLKPKSAEIFSNMTKAGVGKKINIVIGNVIVTMATIQTPISGDFLIAGISREKAQAFVNGLKKP